LDANSIRGVAAGAREHELLTNSRQWPMCCDHLVIQGGGRQENKPSEPRKPSILGKNGSTERQDNNCCRWEWKFSLDSDRRPELWCRCQTCGVKYYLSSWQWTLDSDRNGKCVPPTGKHLVTLSESAGASVQAAGSIAPPAGASANGGTGKMRAAPRASSERPSARPNGCRRNRL
jgi:hypothetical protein